MKILDLDALITIPLSVPLKGPGIVITPNDFVKAMKQVTKSRKKDFSEVDPENVINGKTYYYALVAYDYGLAPTQDLISGIRGRLQLL